MTARVGSAAGGTRAWTDPLTWTPNGTPVAGDDLTLDGTSGNVTIDTGAVARSLDCTGYTGTLTHSAGVTLTLGDGTAGAGNVALKLVAGMTYTINTGSLINFASTSATQQTITSGGKTMRSIGIVGTGSSYVLTAANTLTGSFTLAAGTFDTGNFACTWDLVIISGATAKTLTLGSSAIAITGVSGASATVTGSNITFTANTAVMTFSGSSAGLSGAFNWNGLSVVFTSAVSDARLVNGPTVNNVTVNGVATKAGQFRIFTGNPAITGTLTVTGNSATNRVLFSSGTTGTPQTVTVGTAVSLSNVDFQDITAAGAAGTWTGTSMGNALGNSNITFDAPTTQTHTASAGGNWSDVTKWTSRVPLPQDNVIVDVNTTGTLTADMPRLGADVTFTGFAGTFTLGNAIATYGSLVLAAGMTLSGVFATTLSGRSAHVLTSSGKTFINNVNIAAPGGTYTLSDAFSQTGSGGLAVNNGTLDGSTNNVNVIAPFFVTSPGAILNMGTGTWTMTFTTAGTPWNFASTATLNNSSGSTIIYSSAATAARTFAGGGKTYGTLTYTVAGSTGSLTITGANTFGTINFSDVTNARSLLFTAATTTTVTGAFNVVGTVGKLMTVDSATAATHTLSTGGMVSTDYLNIANSTATGGSWYAGANSVNAGGNTGWIFTAPPAAGAGRRALLGVGR